MTAYWARCVGLGSGFAPTSQITTGPLVLGNVQAMPGYTNDLRLTLDEPGTYLISCLEFCGRDHHRMFREFEVTGG